MTADLDHDEIRPAGGITISAAVGADIVAAFNELAALAAPRGGRLSPRYAAIRTRLTHAITHVDASTKVVAGEDVLRLQRDEVADSRTVAEMLGLTSAGITWLCRNGRLEGTKSGRQWLIGMASVQNYQAQRRMRKAAA